MDLLNRCTALAYRVLRDPASEVSLINSAIQAAQLKIMVQCGSESGLIQKPQVHARLIGIPLCPITFYSRIPGVEVGFRLVAVRGTVTRLGPVKMTDRQRTFQCTKCKTHIVVQADDHQGGLIPRPAWCEAIVDDERCNSNKFNACEDITIVKDDYQEIRIQELTSLLEIGAVPRSLSVILRHDLVDMCKAGDEVSITGWMVSRWKYTAKSGSRCEVDFALVANNIYIANSRAVSTAQGQDHREFATKFWATHCDSPLRGRDLLINSFCPQIYGLHLVKLAVLLTVIGGGGGSSASSDASIGARKHRKEGHLLLVGDPGTAKSQFLLSAAKMVPRSVVTTGSGSTNAGLTVAAVKEAGEWQLEAGALVLADCGLCCIDEFNALRPHDRTAIHEAMEQQTLSVAKAGLVCKLQTRCSIVAACNAKGKFEEGEPISANVALASPLLSRFDLILVMTDRRSEEWDRSLSGAILEAACRRGHSRKAEGMSATIDVDTLRSYVNYVRMEGDPAMSPGARIVLGKYYQLQRKSDLRDAARTTIRLLESLIRLAQAHTKLMHQDTVKVTDAVWAIVLMETSLSTQSVLSVRPDVYAAAATDAEEQYSQYEDTILKRLQINLRVLDVGLELDREAEEILCSWPLTQQKCE